MVREVGNVGTMGRLGLIGLIGLLGLIAFGAGAYWGKMSVRAVGAVNDTVRTVFVDTVPFAYPVPRDSVVVRWVIRTLGVVNDSGAVGANGANEATVDSVKLLMPITQKKYESEDYKAWVSGYDASLDSIHVYSRREIITTREPTKKSKRLGLGMMAGYGVTPNGLQPYVGVGVSYKLWEW